MPRNQTLDLLRSIGIIHVVLFHVLHGLFRFVPEVSLSEVLSRYPFWMNFTWQPLGVDVIFMISAYLLSLGLLRDLDQKNSINLRAYYIRRVSRIIPLYYIAIIIFALAQQNSMIEVIMAICFVQFLITGQAIVPVGWSMELMMLVYICLPAIIVLMMRFKNPLGWMYAAITASLAIRFIPLAANPDQATVLFTHLLARNEVLPLAEDLYFRPWFRLTPFLLGIALAFFVSKYKDTMKLLILTKQRRAALYTSAALLVYIALFLPIHDPSAWIYAITTPIFWAFYWTLNGSAFALAACLIVIARHDKTNMRGPWAMISRNIMGIYLFHMPLILVGAVVVFRSTQKEALLHTTVWHVWGVFIVAITLSLAISALLTRFIETPIQMVLRRKMRL